VIVGIVRKTPSQASSKRFISVDTDKHMQISEVQDGKLVTLRGWAYRVRKQKKFIFIILRDSTGLLQCIIKEGSKAFKIAEKVTTESSIQLRGIVKKEARAPTGYELQVRDLEIVGLAETYPIARDLSEEFLLDFRHLSLRLPKYQAIMRIRSKVFEATHEYLRKQDYLECHPPMFVLEGSEGGATQFKLDYFGKEVSLTQSWQLHAEAMVQALERVYYIGPSFRAEKSRTRRHVTEFWHCEIEAAWVGMDEMLKTGEELIAYVCKKVAKDCKRELKTLGRDATKLSKIKAPFKKLTYAQAVKKLKCRYGIDFGIKEEKQLTDGLDAPLTITHYPKKIMPFYKRKSPKDKDLTLSFSTLCPGLGETIDGSEREPDLKEIIKSFKGDPKKLGFYLDTRKYGAVPHSGFGLGMARLIMWICGLDSIRDAIPFPRTPTRYYP